MAKLSAACDSKEPDNFIIFPFFFVLRISGFRFGSPSYYMCGGWLFCFFIADWCVCSVCVMIRHRERSQRSDISPPPWLSFHHSCCTSRTTSAASQEASQLTPDMKSSFITQLLTTPPISPFSYMYAHLDR